jgi:hypothetical protein
MEAVARLLAPDGSLWLLVNHEWSDRLRLAMENTGFHWRQAITWYETFGVNGVGKFNRCSRPLLWMTRHRRVVVVNADVPQVRRPSDRLKKYRDSRANPAGKLLDHDWIIPRVAERTASRSRTPRGQFGVLDGAPGCIVPAGHWMWFGPQGPGCRPVQRIGHDRNGRTACTEIGRRFVGIEASWRFAGLARLRLARAGTLGRIPPKSHALRLASRAMITSVAMPRGPAT